MKLARILVTLTLISSPCMGWQTGGPEETLRPGIEEDGSHYFFIGEEHHQEQHILILTPAFQNHSSPAS